MRAEYLARSNANKLDAKGTYAPLKAIQMWLARVVLTSICDEDSYPLRPPLVPGIFGVVLSTRLDVLQGVASTQAKYPVLSRRIPHFAVRLSSKPGAPFALQDGR
jgi:hypothetical protein